jgi:diguanylate cyclase (GGDEF)-like protein
VEAVESLGQGQSEGQSNRLLNQFRDPSLESAFRQHSLPLTLMMLRVIAVLGILGAASVHYGGLVSGLAAEAPVAFGIGTALRVAFAVSCVVLLITVWRRHTRYLYTLTSGVFALAGLVIAQRMTQLPAPDADTLGQLFYITRDGISIYLALSLATLLLVPGRFGTNAVISSVTLILYLLLYMRQAPPNALRTILGSIIVFALFVGAGYAVQRARRHYFSIHRRLAEANRQLRHLASVDVLTGVFNRRYFLDLLKRELQRSNRRKHEVSLILMDVDHFKRVNDHNGHPAGDEVLRQLSKALVDTLRSDDVVGRVGGEEFAFMLPETSAATAEEVAERLRVVVEATRIESNDHHISVTASFGIAAAPCEENSTECLLSRADGALYAAKEAGRNCVRSDRGPSE